MNRKLQTKLVKLSLDLISLPVGPNKHFTYIINKNKIVSLGFNHYRKSHPLGKLYGLHDGTLHSEVAAITRFQGRPADLMYHSLVNVRVNREGDVQMSRPCQFCRRMLSSFGFNEVWWTTPDGKFERS